MTLLLLNRQRTIAVSLAILVVALSLGALGVRLSADDQTPYEVLLQERGAEIGQTHALGGDTDIALYVNGHPVTTAALYKQQADSKNFLDVMQGRIDRAVPDSEYNAVSEEEVAALERGEIVNKDLFDGVSPVPESMIYPMRSRVALVQEYGPDTMALAIIIQDSAVFGMALEAGHEATDQQVAERVAEAKTWLEAGFSKSVVKVPYTDPETGKEILLESQTPRDYKLEGYINAVGADRYWNQISARRNKIQPHNRQPVHCRDDISRLLRRE